jgi:AbrB family looped-hinge helix DNA binding protein
MSVDDPAHTQEVTVSKSGQTTIPKHMREVSGIDAPGTVLVTLRDDGSILIEPAPTVDDLVGFAGLTEGDGPRVTEQLRAKRQQDKQTDERTVREEFADVFSADAE